jgi:Mycothiol maleylpyruvate isomerase N-terminal domain
VATESDGSLASSGLERSPHGALSPLQPARAGSDEPPLSQRQLLAAEDAGWDELHTLLGELTPEELERRGYYVEGWSGKDLLAHVGSWLAEAAIMLERIRSGTYRPEEIDVDAMNALSLEAMKDAPNDVVKAQAAAARTRMLQAWAALPETTPEAAFWISKAGAEHYGEHLTRLRDWVGELHAARSQ